MRCLKCLTEHSSPLISNSGNEAVDNIINNWYICKACSESNVMDIAEKVHQYYMKNKKHYRELHKGYKDKLTDSYVANALVDRSDLKAKDIPKEVVQAKRQYMKLHRIIKEDKE